MNFAYQFSIYCRTEENHVRLFSVWSVAGPSLCTRVQTQVVYPIKFFVPLIVWTIITYLISFCSIFLFVFHYVTISPSSNLQNHYVTGLQVLDRSGCPQKSFSNWHTNKDPLF